MPLRPGPHATRSERGFALVVSLLVLMLSAIAAITYFSVATGERAQSSNVHVARASLYAADAGVRAVEQLLANRAKAKLDSLALLWSGSGPLITNPQTFFPAGATTATSTNPAFSASGTVTFSDSTLAPNAQAYDYLFTITSSGSRGAFGRRAVQSQGILRVSASRGEFADFLLFTQAQLLPGGGEIWLTSDGQFDGRMHTNGEFRFAYKPSFQDLVTSVNSKAWYYNKGSPVERSANSNGTIDVPDFYGGFQRGTAPIDLPANAYGQQNAALGRDPANTTSPTNAQVNAALGLSGSSTPPNGIYLPDSAGALKGGIYVQGTLSRFLMSVDTDGRQVYTLTQGTTTRTITVDRGTNQTSMFDGTTTITREGVPRGVLYCNGPISDLRGPDRVGGEPLPALADGTRLLIAASGDVVVQRDITCKDFNSGTNVLGIYSSGGSVRVGTGAPNDLNLDAYIMAAGTSGALAVDSYDFGSPRGAFHLRGGAVTRYYGAFYTFNSNGTLKSGYARDFHYDRRGLVPPYYPTTPRLVPDVPQARTLAWKEA